jgi:hypothetical protein
MSAHLRRSLKPTSNLKVQPKKGTAKGTLVHEEWLKDIYSVISILILQSVSVVCSANQSTCIVIKYAEKTD